MTVNLPETTREHEQEENSITAFRVVMRDSNFIIRDIRESDYGVDLNIEAKIIDDKKKFASNFLCQIQIKDKLESSSIDNNDGTFSYKLKIRSLNYLLNNPASIFMIYLEDKDYFVWEWANEIENFAMKKGIDLNSTSQQSITYRFFKKLNSESISEMYTRIVNIGKNIKRLQKLILENNQGNFIKKEELLNSIENKNKLIEKYIGTKDYDRALRLCSNLANVVEGEEIFIKCSILALLSHKYKKAVSYCNKALNINSENSIVHLIRSSAYTELKNYKQAIKSIEKSIAIKETLDGYIQYGILNFVTGNNLGAINALKKALSFDEENEQALLVLGGIYTALFNTSKAIYFIQKVLSINSNNSQALALLGDNYRNQDKYQEAIENYHKCLDINTTEEMGLIGLGLAMVANNQIDEGLIYISKWVSVYQRNLLGKGKRILLIHIGWEKTFFLKIIPDGDNQIKVSLDNGYEISLNLPNQNDKILIGILRNIEGTWVIPLVGKSYGNKIDFENTIKKVSEKLNPINSVIPTGKIVDVYNKTKLFIKEEKDRVYIELNLNGYVINGHTNGDNKKSGFYEFVKSYNDMNAYQVSFYNEEEDKEVMFTIDGNVVIKLLEK